MKNIGKIIESQLQILNMTQTELGNMIGLNQRTISQYIHGHSQPSLETLSKICNILKIDISYVLEIPKYDNDDIHISNKNEATLIKNYRKLDEHDQQTILAISKVLTVIYEKNK